MGGKRGRLAYEWCVERMCGGMYSFTENFERGKGQMLYYTFFFFSETYTMQKKMCKE
jgi:hypothetical protein